MAVPDFVGAAACAECHQAIYDAWHARRTAARWPCASPDTVLAPSRDSTTLADGRSRSRAKGTASSWSSPRGGRTERRKVDVTVASGRQHQLYAMQGERRGAHAAPRGVEHQDEAVAPAVALSAADLSPDVAELLGGAGHDARLRQLPPQPGLPARRAPTACAAPVWICRSTARPATAPGRSTSAAGAAGRTDEVYRDLSKLGSVEESRVCGGCHGFQLKRYVFPPADDELPQIFVTSLINESLRADGTQHLTSYQYPGHVLSAGFRGKILRCKDCHAPHGLEARTSRASRRWGRCRTSSAPVVTRSWTRPSPPAGHTHHSAAVRCVDCHMSYSCIGDDDRRHQRTSDHSISIPHPAGDASTSALRTLATPATRTRRRQWALAALTRWGMKDALGVRDWVETIALGRKKAPGAATQRLVALLTKHDTGTYLQASALDLLDVQPRDPALVATLAPFARDPDPYLRAAAIRALETHDDPAARPGWLTLGLADAHPFVRLETFSMVKDVKTLSPEQLDRELADVLAYMSPPDRRPRPSHHRPQPPRRAAAGPRAGRPAGEVDAAPRAAASQPRGRSRGNPRRARQARLSAAIAANAAPVSQGNTAPSGDGPSTHPPPPLDAGGGGWAAQK